MQRLLVVVDMQNDFIDGSLGTKEAQAIVPGVIERIKTFEGTVLFTRDTHTKNYLQTAEGKKLPIEHCIKGTKGWELQADIDSLQKELKAPVFDKITFGSKGLAEYISDNIVEFGGISSIVICGLCTDICVISNALLLKAYLPEIPIVIDSSICAGVTSQSHDNALKAMEMCQIEVVKEI
ncbi:MAG: cysteine hydrolase family protein [Lachnospiraceae bacterium]